jgi:hypothetical protein
MPPRRVFRLHTSRNGFSAASGAGAVKSLGCWTLSVLERLCPNLMIVSDRMSQIGGDQFGCSLTHAL